MNGTGSSWACGLLKMGSSEMDPRKKSLIRIGITVVVGALIAWGAAAARGLKPGIGTALTLRYWSDGCFAAAVLIGGIGVLTWISTTGLFDIFSYGISAAVRMFIPFGRKKDIMPFYDYKTYKAEKRQPALFELLVVGIFYLLVSGLLLWLYYSSIGGA